MLHSPSIQISGLILAGGAGRRFGDVDKGWLQVAGRPLIERVVARLAPQVSDLAINANRHQAAYAALGYTVIADCDAGFNGPLAGLYPGLDACRAPYLLYAPVDAAHLPADLAQRLFAALKRCNTRAAVVHDGLRSNPVCGLLAQDLAASLRQAVAGGERSPQRWLAGVGAAAVDFSHWPRTYWSVNTPTERSRLEADLQVNQTTTAA